MKRHILLALAVGVACATWLYAGYTIGYTLGRGWRGALIDNGCTVVCKVTL